MSSMNVLGSAGPDAVIADPYAHLVRTPALPAEIYAELARTFPDQATILGDRESFDNAAARLPAFKVAEDQRIAPIWREFFEFHTSAAFWREIVRVFGPALRQTHPGVEARVGRPLEEWIAGPRRDRSVKDEIDARLDCQFVINTPAQEMSSVKSHHIDKPTTIFSMLYYFRDPADPSEGGNLDLCTWKREPRFLRHRMILAEDVEQQRTVKYAPNTLLSFVNSIDSVHAVSPRGPSDLPRRYVNFIVETPFDAFAVPRLGIAERIIYWRQTRQIAYRNIGGDRY